MINDFFTTQWRHHVGGEDAFPRDLAYVKDPSPLSKRFKVYDWHAFVLEVWRHIGNLDTFVAIFSDDQINHNVYDKIFIDIDAPNLQDAYDDVQKLKAFEVKTHTISMRTYFSGKKGFHVFLDFPPTQFEHYKEVSRQYVETLENALDLNYIDYSVVGGITRLSRLPYTKHTTTGYLCFPISTSMTLETIIEYAQGYRGDRDWPPLQRKQTLIHSKLLKNLDEHYTPPERVTSSAENAFTMSQDLVHIANHAPKFKGLNRIAYAKILPIFKAKDRPINEVLAFITNIENRMGANFRDTVDRNWVRSAYKIEKGIPWSWGVIFKKWPEIQRWFKDD